MAVEFSISHLSFTPGISTIRIPSNSTTLALKTTSIFPRNRQCPLYCKSNLGFETARRFFTPSVCINNAQPEVNKDKEGKAGEKQSYDLKTLINTYKEAILTRDEETASEIEKIILILENEKNELVQKVTALSADIAAEKSKYILTQADFDNFRKRLEKDQRRLTSNTQRDVLESLLPVVDNFEKAKLQIRPETEKAKKINTSYQSIYKQFVEIMRSLRISVVETVGKPFDPLLHEAVAREESQGYKEGIITQEIRRGFVLGEQILRPAVVKVSTGPGHKKAPEPTKQSEEEPITAGLDGESNN
ncbi:Grpe [Thalictrum thalictroides]|uniref:GrpE protein homolog n=1 Tax=Thalictrum thalictroides TaxID=46969 RepID=A0A7J6WB89_THATH|nr:Grpe [Thalictrum thalictroides]